MESSRLSKQQAHSLLVEKIYDQFRTQGEDIDGNPMCIYVVTADHAGYGDLMFGLKTSKLLNTYFPKARIIMVTNPPSACDIMTVNEEPKVQTIKSLSLKSIEAYLIYNDQLFYVNTNTSECIEINLGDDKAQKLPRLQEQLKPGYIAKTLSEQELTTFTNITGYFRPKVRGIEAIKLLKGDKEYDVEVISTEEFIKRIAYHSSEEPSKKSFSTFVDIDCDDEIEEKITLLPFPSLVIEAPVFSLIKDRGILSLLSERAKKERRGMPPFLMMSEYSANKNVCLTTLSATQQSHDPTYACISKLSAIDTGFLPGESGILLEPAASTERENNVLSADLTQAIFQNPAECKNDLGIIYTRHFHKENLEFFAEFHRNSGVNVDMVLLGNEHAKCNDISEYHDRLMINGFKILILHDLATHKKIVYDLSANTVLNRCPDNGGRVFRILHKKSIPHQDFLALNQLAGRFRCVTGDQSFGEVFSNSDTIVAYESLKHKWNLISGLRILAEKFEKDYKGIYRAVQLLTWGAEGSEKEKLTTIQIDMLGELIRSPVIINGLKQLSNYIRQHCDLSHVIVLRVNYLLIHNACSNSRKNFEDKEHNIFLSMDRNNQGSAIAELTQLIAQWNMLSLHDYVTPYKNNCLHEAILDRNRNDAVYFLRNGDHPDGCEDSNNRFGDTPLILAINKNCFSIVKLLLINGANPNKPFKGKYPLEIADELGNKDIIQLIESTNPELRKHFGVKPILLKRDSVSSSIISCVDDEPFSPMSISAATPRKLETTNTKFSSRSSMSGTDTPSHMSHDSQSEWECVDSPTELARGASQSEVKMHIDSPSQMSCTSEQSPASPMTGAQSSSRNRYRFAYARKALKIGPLSQPETPTSQREKLKPHKIITNYFT